MKRKPLLIVSVVIVVALLFICGGCWAIGTWYNTTPAFKMTATARAESQAIATRNASSRATEKAIPTNTKSPTNTAIPTATKTPFPTASDRPTMVATDTPQVTATKARQPALVFTATRPSVVKPTNSPAPTPVPTVVPATGGYACSNGQPCIKGNISSSGEKIYHFPGCGSYNQTKIDESQGERWFTTAAEAEAAGWRKAQNCP